MNGELIFDGKKYISARRASEVCGYSSDYIGQLCRKGSLDCRMVGRSWFVEENSLKNHQEEAGKKVRGRIEIYQGPRPKEISSQTPPVSTGITSQEEKPLAQLTAEDYVDGEKDKREATRFSVKVALGFFALLLLLVSFPVLRTINPDNFKNSFVRLEENILDANILSGANNALSAHDISIPENIRWLRVKTHSLTLMMYHKLSLALHIVPEGMKKLASLTLNQKDSSRDMSSEKNGVVVVPSTKDPVKDEKVKQYIKDSFSDEANIMPDGTGTSGAIRPVFRSGTEDEYLYVIVPVVDE